jgi:hypothetical protein
MAAQAPPPQARWSGALAGLGTGWTTFLAVDAILVVTFLVLLVMQVASGQSGHTAAPGPTTQTSSSSPEPETSPEPTAPTAPEENQELTEFILPSGNIWCSMTETSATCAIGQFSYTPPGKPASCTGTVGQVFEVTAEDGATLPCVQEVPPRPRDATALEYGQASTIGEMTCYSSKNGATCRHNPTGDGFSVARAGYTIL